MSHPTTKDDEREYFTQLHHKVAELLGYKQTPGYASWDKVEETAPVQVVDRLTAFISREIAEIIGDDIRTHRSSCADGDMFTECDCGLNRVNNERENIRQKAQAKGYNLEQFKEGENENT